MSGHSHWATIKHEKSAEDARRGQAFTKVTRLISVAARKGGGDSASNPALRAAIEKARAVQMGNDLIDRAIKRALGEGREGELLELKLEGYGPGGVGFLVEVLTDNRNRTVSEVRNIFMRRGGNLGEAGSAAYIFREDPKNPTFFVPLGSEETEKQNLDLMEELKDHADVTEVYTNFRPSRPRL